MEHVIRIPQECHNFIHKFATLVSLKVSSGRYACSRFKSPVGSAAERETSMDFRRLRKKTFNFPEKKMITKSSDFPEKRALRGLDILCFFFFFQNCPRFLSTITTWMVPKEERKMKFFLQIPLSHFFLFPAGRKLYKIDFFWGGRAAADWIMRLWFFVLFSLPPPLLHTNAWEREREKKSEFIHPQRSSSSPLSLPNRQRTFSKLPTELRCGSFVDKHRPSIANRRPNVQKRVRNVCMFRLSFHFAYHPLVVGRQGATNFPHFNERERKKTTIF